MVSDQDQNMYHHGSDGTDDESAAAIVTRDSATSNPFSDRQTAATHASDIRPLSGVLVDDAFSYASYDLSSATAVSDGGASAVEHEAALIRRQPAPASGRRDRHISFASNTALPHTPNIDG
jgi:hypothetical protein